MKKNAQIFLAAVDVAKSDFLRCVGAVQILIEKAERFARIDLDRSRSEIDEIPVAFNCNWRRGFVPYAKWLLYIIKKSTEIQIIKLFPRQK